MPRLIVDDVPCEVPEGASLLDAARRVGVDVPTLCHDPRLGPQGACRLCVVAVDGRPQPVASCATPALDGMVVRTRTDEIVELRRTLLGLLAADHPADAVESTPDARFHRLLHEYGVAATGRRDPSLVDDSHPLMHVDMSLCIDCFRCVQVCDEIEGRHVWRIVGRGVDTRVVPDSGTTLATSSCVACGACVDACPTGAIADRVPEVGDALVPAAQPAPPVEWTRTVCPYCGVGCELVVGARDGAIVGVRAPLDAPVNHGLLCVKGRHGYGFNGAADRLTTPLYRDGDTWRPISWDDAEALLARELLEVLAARGPSAIGLLGSARATNEDNYVLQKFARAVVGTNNVDCCARVCHAPSATALRTMFGTGAATSSYDDIERARTIMVVGSNATENHPVVGARILRAAASGAALIVLDPRRTEIAARATVHLRHRPGATITVLNAMAATVLEEGLEDREFLDARVAEPGAYEAFVRAYSPDAVAEQCGVDANAIRAAARLYATGRPSISFHGLGVTEHEQGTDGVMALADLALLTGNLGRPGAGVNPLRGQNNVQGSAHMGCEPHQLTGFVPVTEGGARFAEAWGAPVPTARGLDAMEMIDAADAGELGALWVVGWDLAQTQPDLHATRRALGRIGFVVVQDLFLNETAREVAHLVLPAASAFEHDGTFMNAERRVQRVRAVVPPPGEARPDWEIVARVARRMGRGDLFDYSSAQDVWDEIRTVWPAGAGITYRRLDTEGGLQWPCPTEDHPGTGLLHAESFPGLGARTALRLVVQRPPSEQPSHEYPLTLVTGRGLYQFNAGTMTRRSAPTVLHPTDVLEISPVDAHRLGIDDAAPVRLTSAHGEAVLPACVTSRVAPGVVFATFSDPAVRLNVVIGPARDAATHAPAYKVTAVQVTPVPAVRGGPKVPGDRVGAARP